MIVTVPVGLVAAWPPAAAVPEVVVACDWPVLDPDDGSSSPPPQAAMNAAALAVPMAVRDRRRFCRVTLGRLIVGIRGCPCLMSCRMLVRPFYTPREGCANPTISVRRCAPRRRGQCYHCVT